MKIIEIRPSKRFRYHWEAYEGEGRFGGCAGEIHVYSQEGSALEDKIIIDAETK